MGTENTFEVKFFINGEEVDSLVDVPFIRNNEDDPVTTVAETLYKSYKAFNEAGFDSKQAFALTRDWFDVVLEKSHGEEN